MFTVLSFNSPLILDMRILQMNVVAWENALKRNRLTNQNKVNKSTNNQGNKQTEIKRETGFDPCVSSDGVAVIFQ